MMEIALFTLGAFTALSLVVLALWLVIRHLSDPGRSLYYMAALVRGFGTSTRYHGVVVQNGNAATVVSFDAIAEAIEAGSLMPMLQRGDHGQTYN